MEFQPLIVITLTLVAFASVYVQKRQKRAKSTSKPRVPTLSEFPAGTEFIVKESDIPLARIPGDSHCIWVNWYGGKACPFDVAWLKLDNNWSVKSFDTWEKVVKASLK